jgi:hypothetical protein
MGLSVGYSVVGSRVSSPDEARNLVSEFRQIAKTYPFKEIGRVRRLTAKDVQKGLNSNDENVRWDFCGLSESVKLPWCRKDAYVSISVHPTELFMFTVWPGEGCESTSIGLATYPDTIEVTWRPDHDRRFVRKVVKAHAGGFKSTSWELDYDKLHRARMANRDAYKSLCSHTRIIPTNIKHKWSHGTCCKTQYASDPEAGGVTNFLACHISLVAFLEEIGRIPGVRVRISDEGHYGPSTYSDDYQEAYAAGRTPKYVPHKATHSVDVLLKQLGDYNSLIAAVAGALKDHIADSKLTMEAPILKYQNFEQLEFKGHNNPDLKPFLRAMSQLNKPQTTEA